MDLASLRHRTRPLLLTAWISFNVLPIWSIAAGQDFYDVPQHLQMDHREAKVFEKWDKQEALSLHGSLYKKEKNSFTITYDYAKFLARIKKYDDAKKVVDRAIALFERNEKGDLTVYNTKGFILAMLGQHEDALTYFKKEEKDPRFGNLPKQSRMKLFNNTGFSLLKSDRYEEAIFYFEKAKGLGSTLAEKNLRVVDSILEALRAESEDLAGVFAPGVGSAKSEVRAKAMIPNLASRLGVKPSDLRIFQNDAGRYVITHGANLSYPKAERLVASARKQGIRDAWIASTLSWTAIPP